MLDGSLPAAEQSTLGGHLETCVRCRQTLEELAAGRDAWCAAARHLRGETSADGPALYRVLADLEADAEGPAGDEALPELLGPAGRLGRYEVLGVLGRGGMGVVLKAFDRPLDRVVAIKVMAPQLATHPGARRRFVREARAAAAVRNEHVIGIHAVDDVNHLPYLVMEYVAGPSLQQRLDQGGPLGLEETLRIGRQIALGLAAAHAQGLVHRDIKPANILLEDGGACVKITDFGLARAADDVSTSQSGIVAGTPQYMAPEQTRGEPPDYRADLFSLGSVLYALCTGLPPFPAGSTLAVLREVCEDTPRPIREINPEVPFWLVGTVARLQAKDPAERFASAAEVADLLGEQLARLTRPAPAAPARRRRWLAVAAALLLSLGGVGLAEATGITHLSSAVIRVFTPDGTLIVDVDDPQVRVTVEGDGGLTITGAGPQEVRLRPGSYRFRASKDGKTVRDDLLTIARGDRQVVKVSGEAVAAAPVAQVPAGAFCGHTDSILCLAIAPDGRRALSGSADKTVRLWDVMTGLELRRFLGHTDDVTSVAFSPDGKRAVSGGSDRTVRVWDVETGGALGCLRGHTEPVRSAALSADGRFVVSGGQDGTVRLWDAAQGIEVQSFLGHNGCVTSVALCRDGERILSGGYDGTVRLWDRKAGQELRRFEGVSREVYAVALAPDGRRAVFGGNDKVVRLWDLTTGEVLGRLAGHANAVICVAFSADGRLVLSASSQYQAVDKTLRIWDAATCKELFSCGGAASDRVGCAAFAPDGRTALSGGPGPALRLWHLSK
jgi:WD40 repeat protein